MAGSAWKMTSGPFSSFVITFSSSSCFSVTFSPVLLKLTKLGFLLGRVLILTSTGSITDTSSISDLVKVVLATDFRTVFDSFFDSFVVSVDLLKVLDLESFLKSKRLAECDLGRGGRLVTTLNDFFCLSNVDVKLADFCSSKTCLHSLEVLLQAVENSLST